MFGSRVEIRPCPPEERGRALGALYRRAPSGVRLRMVAETLEDAARGDLDLSGLWVARRRGRIVGALLTQGLAGRAAAVWPPEVGLFLGRSSAAAALVRAVIDDFRARGFRIAQALIDGSSPRQGSGDLARGGMP